MPEEGLGDAELLTLIGRIGWTALERGGGRGGGWIGRRVGGLTLGKVAAVSVVVAEYELSAVRVPESLDVDPMLSEEPDRPWSTLSTCPFICGLRHGRGGGR